ncbi:hypothetical protein ACFQ7A_04795 [Streptomyces sp. NPDC056528]|uniref:hypothetical protein n=1 Tax=Streptomyces sp. NPDC056528 TaxID=3345854 RepID=UPI0036BD5BEC
MTARLHRVHLDDCSEPSAARQEAVNLLWPFMPTRKVLEQDALNLMSCYLMAAALDGTGLETVRAWAADPEDHRAVELLRAGPVPAWAEECERILTCSQWWRGQILAPVRLALSPDRASAA